MNKLIKYFNKKYGKEYGKISYPRTTIQIYQVYQIIKDCNIEDNELTKLLHNVKLPKPKTMEEMEMYSECINDGIPQNKMMPQILNEYTIELTADELNNLEYHESMAGNHRVLDFSKYNIDFQKLNKFVIYMGIDFDSLCRVQDSTSYDSIYYDSNYIEYYTNTLNNEMKIYSSEKFTQGRIIKIFEITGYINDMYITPKDNIAIGGFARKNNIAVGEGAIAPNSNSIAIGTEVFAKGNSSCAQGSYVTANGDSSCAQGRGTIARGDYSHAEGLGTETNTVADAAHAEGYNTKASSDYQHVQGKYNIEDTENKYAHIVGNGKSGMERSNAHTLDWNGNAWYAGDVQANNVPYVASEKVVLTVPAASITAKKTEIDNLINDNSEPVQIPVDGTVTYDPTKSYYVKYNNTQYHAIYIDGALGIVENGCECIIATISGNTVLAVFLLDTTNTTDMQLIEKDIKNLDNMYIPNDLKVNNSITVGARKGRIGAFSSSFGLTCKASGDKSHAEGDGTIASGECSHAEGSETTALGECSHAEGDNTTAVGDCSHAEGSGTQASGNCSHAEGGGTVASGSKSHAEGTSTAAPGDSSHSEGKYTGAPGNCSHAEGYNTKASSDYQHVQGKYNIEDTENKYAHIVGNGTDNSTRSNAHTLDWNGNAWFAGDVYVKGDNQDNGKKLLSTSDIYFNENGELVVTINGVTKIFTPKA